MRIGELAHATAVSRDTLRFYEQRGLISAQRTGNSYRHYPVETVQRGARQRLRQSCPLSP
ncbi:MerR family DNA-binding transcriptional regulator [Pseudomonas cichorii]|nr:MerR family DNA-binding transcriptional regulator [Pseudomonas cichorii]MBX8540184.1 MerR family DNA-binding transcriptional regulator [Pseudomonas cichorii]MBX8567000.1 MerR family DNA-binding transcriptional regulator [Pseudomonas cichorii]MBX8579754.1 MerR family DNA-binding transcriptional regulator [Pseudomonas cichorii]MBX8590435.1 MerR family DNA-binding transcriptional regulator [Pseudomonas cichorii]